MKSIKEIGRQYTVVMYYPFCRENHVVVRCGCEKKYCLIHYTAKDGIPYIWYNRTTWAVCD